MANKKISELTALTEAAAADALPIVDDSASETKKITFSDLVGGASKTELSYLVGVTSSIQTQLDGKIPKSIGTTAGDIIYFTGSGTPVRLGIGTTGQVLTVNAGATAPTWSTAAAGGYATIQEEGTGLTQRTIMNFIGNGITAADDAVNSRTNITLDATLNSISALGTAADKMLYTTGVDTWAEATLTAFGRSLIDDADAATARTTLGLPIGFSSKARAYLSSAQSIPHAAWTKINFNAESYDVLGEFDTTTNYRFTAQAAGYYAVSAIVSFAANAAGIRSFFIKKNGTTIVTSGQLIASAGSSVITRLVASDILYLAANDYLEVFAYQDSGSSLNTDYGEYCVAVAIHRLS